MAVPGTILATEAPRVSAAPGRASALPLGARLRRKAGRVAQDSAKSARHWAARAVFALPWWKRRDPRRRVTTLGEYCTRVDRAPHAGAGLRDWYLPLPADPPVATTASHGLGGRTHPLFTAGIATYQGGGELRYPERFLASVEGARLYGSRYLLLSRDHHIFFDSALSHPAYLDETGILDRVFLPAPRRIPGEFCVLANRSARAYYHWIVEGLPRLALFDASARLAGVPLVVPSELHAFHRDSLQLAGVAEERIRPLPPGFWELERMYYPSLPGPTGIPAPSAVRWLRDRFLPAPDATARPDGRRLYLARCDATQRRVLNEPELIAALDARGFEAVCPGALSFSEQLALFADASVVVAPHGAGLTNLAFAPRGVTVVELFGDNYVNGCYWALANLCGHRHAHLVGRSQWLDYSIPLADLQTLLDELGA